MDRVRYGGVFWDSARWEGLELRPGDIIVATPAKSGTTWTQMICALLIFQDPDLPFDQTLIKVDPRLRYSELMTVINAFSNAFVAAKKEPKLSFIELGPDEGE